MVGKLPPVRVCGPRSATGRSTQSSPLGSLTFGTGGPKLTGKHRAMRILWRNASSWITYTCLTALVSGVGTEGSPVFVGTGLTSSLPMMPSSHDAGLVMRLGGPNSIPAELPPRGVGERYMTRVLSPKSDGGQLACANSSLVR